MECVRFSTCTGPAWKVRSKYFHYESNPVSENVTDIGFDDDSVAFEPSAGANMSNTPCNFVKLQITSKFMVSACESAMYFSIAKISYLATAGTS